MGVVFAGTHIEQNVPVAIKVITRKGAEHPRFRQALRNEVQAVATLNHPGIVRVLDHGDIQKATEISSKGELRAQTPYYVMEYLEHGTLQDICGRVTWKQAKALLLSILDALAHAHAMGVIHRDIKPGNILLAQFAGRALPKLADFGLAYAIEKSERAARSIGTPPYMAPEQIAQPWRQHGPWTDIYALGCVAFELMTGYRAFAVGSIKDIFDAHLTGDRRDFKPIVRVPEAFEAWMDKALSPRVEDRFQNAAEASRALATLDERGLKDVQPPMATDLPIAGMTPVLDTFWAGDKRQDTFQRAWSTFTPSIKEESPIPAVWNTPRYEPTPPNLAGAGLGLFGLRITPLVGRIAELDQLWSGLRHVASTGQMDVAHVKGPQGVGRTRFGNWFVQRVMELGVANVLKSSHRREMLSEGLKELARRYFRTHGLTTAETKEALAQELKRLSLDTEYNQRAFLELVSQTPLIEETPFEFSSAKQRYLLVEQLLRKASARGPIVLWMDDIHFDADAVDFLAHLWKATRSAPIPLFVVLTYPDDAVNHLPELEKLPPAAVDIELGHLNQREQVRLIQDLLHLEDDLALELAERTEGNPALAVEIVSNWVARNSLNVGPKGFTLKLKKIEIPSSLRDVWEARISSVSETCEQALPALEIAALLGQEVDLKEWEELCETHELDPDPNLLPELARQRFISLNATGFEFQHVLIREVLQRRAVKEGRWVEYAKSALQLLKRFYDSDRPEIAERIGDYARAAHLPLEAIEPWMNSARRWRGIGAFGSTQHVLMKVLNLFADIELSPEDPRWGQVWAIRARTLLNQSRPTDALQWTQSVLESGFEGWESARLDALVTKALAEQWLGKPTSEASLTHAFEAFSKSAIKEPSVGGTLAHGLISARKFDDAKVLLKHLIEERSAPRDLAMNHHHMGRLAVYAEEWELALEHNQAALERFQSIGHYAGVAQSLEYLGEVHRKRGNLEEAARIYTQCIDLQRAIGFPTVISEINLGSILLEDGAYEEAERLYLLATDTLRRLGQRRIEMAALCGVLAAASGAERWSSARSLLGSIQEMMDEQMEREPEIALLLEKAGDILVGLGRTNEAESSFSLSVRQFAFLEKIQDAERVTSKIEDLDDLSVEFKDL